jgi:hypothetical protein
MWKRPDSTSKSGRTKAISTTLDLSTDTTVSCRTSSTILDAEAKGYAAVLIGGNENLLRHSDVIGYKTLT